MGIEPTAPAWKAGVLPLYDPRAHNNSEHFILNYLSLSIAYDRILLIQGPLAQLVEHVTFNDGVPRSSRGGITKKTVAKQNSAVVVYFHERIYTLYFQARCDDGGAQDFL